VWGALSLPVRFVSTVRTEGVTAALDRSFEKLQLVFPADSLLGRPGGVARQGLARMEFRPAIDPALRPMDARIFQPGPMGIGAAERPPAGA
jgi:hypothetical protein